MEFCDRLKLARERKGLRQNQIAKMLGITATRYNYWEKGKREPDVFMIKKIATVLEISSDWLIGINGESDSISVDTLSKAEFKFIQNFRKLDDEGKKLIGDLTNILLMDKHRMEEKTLIDIPLSRLAVSAGTGEWLDSDETENISIVDTPEARKADIAVRINGDSMEPEYFDNDIALIRLQPAVEPGEVGVFIIDSEGYIKKYTESCLVSLNKKYSDIYPSEYADIRCIGKVVGKAVLP